MGGYAYSRSDPRYRRLYITHELRRKGYRKSHEYFTRTHRAVKVLVYRRRTWEGNVTHDHFVEIWPDGTMKGHHSVEPTLKGF